MAKRNEASRPVTSAPAVGRWRVREALADAGWRRVVEFGVGAIILGAIFPPLRYGGVVSRLGPRGLLAYIAFKTLLGFAIASVARDVRQALERDHAELRAELGRDPTEEEWRRYRLRRSLANQLGRQPTEQELDDAIAAFTRDVRDVRTRPTKE
jgi:hypothetical protein